MKHVSKHDGQRKNEYSHKILRLPTIVDKEGGCYAVSHLFTVYSGPLGRAALVFVTLIFMVCDKLLFKAGYM